MLCSPAYTTTPTQHAERACTLTPTTCPTPLLQPAVRLETRIPIGNLSYVLPMLPGMAGINVEVGGQGRAGVDWERWGAWLLVCRRLCP